MKTVLLIAVLFAACKAPKSAVEAPPAQPAAESPMETNKAVKYVTDLQADVKRAQEAKEKADAANKKAQEAEKLPE